MDQIENYISINEYPMEQGWRKAEKFTHKETIEDDLADKVQAYEGHFYKPVEKELLPLSTRIARICGAVLTLALSLGFAWYSKEVRELFNKEKKDTFGPVVQGKDGHFYRTVQGKDGHFYRLIEKREKDYPLYERIARIVAGVLALVFSLGFAWYSSDIRRLFKSKKVVHFGHITNPPPNAIKIKRIADTAFAVSLQGRKEKITVNIPKNMDSGKASDVIHSIFSSYPKNEWQDILDGNAHVKINNQRFALRPHSPQILLSKLFSFFKPPKKHPNHITLNLIENPASLAPKLLPPTDRPFSTKNGPFWKNNPEALVTIPKGSLQKESLTQEFFSDPFTHLATIAHQKHIKNFVQLDLPLNKREPALQIRELKNSNEHTGADSSQFFVLAAIDAKETNDYESNSHTVSCYHQMLIKNYGAEKIKYIEHQYGLNFEKLIAENKPLTPETVYKINIGVSSIEIQDMAELVEKLKALREKASKEDVLTPLVQWLTNQDILPLHPAKRILEALSKDEQGVLTVADLHNWFEEEAVSRLLEAKKAAALAPKQFNILRSLLDFSDSEREKQYTGNKIEHPILSQYTIAGGDEFKPWIDQQELLQTFDYMKKSPNWNYYNEKLAHVVCKKQIIHAHPTEKYRIGMIIPAPPGKEGEERWYSVTSCINNGAGNISYTLEPACHDDSLPVIKLFRSTASSPYAWDGFSSVKNDLNPLNLTGYEGHSRLAGRNEAFFESRTIPIWMGYTLEAKSCLEKNKSVEEIARNLSQANEAIRKNGERFGKVLTFNELLKKYDATVLDLIVDAKKSEKVSRGDYAAFIHLLVRHCSKKEMKRGDDKKDAALLKRVISKCLNPERQNLLADLQDNIEEPEKKIQFFTEQAEEFKKSVLDKFEAHKTRLDALLKDNKLEEAKEAAADWYKALYKYGTKMGETPEQKNQQNISFVGHSLGSALAQHSFLTHSLLQHRMPCPGKKMELHGFDGPGPAKEDVAAFMKIGAEHQELFKKWGYPFSVTQRFESSDFLGMGGERHVGGCTKEEKAAGVDWLLLDCAVQEVLPGSEDECISGSESSHATHFEGGKREFSPAKAEARMAVANKLKENGDENLESAITSLIKEHGKSNLESAIALFIQLKLLKEEKMASVNKIEKKLKKAITLLKENTDKDLKSAIDLLKKENGKDLQSAVDLLIIVGLLKEDERPGDFRRTWLDGRMLDEADRKTESPLWEINNEIWKLDRIFHWIAPEDFRFFCAMKLRLNNLFPFLGVKDNKQKETLFGPWWKELDHLGVFSVDAEKGVTSNIRSNAREQGRKENIVKSSITVPREQPLVNSR